MNSNSKRPVILLVDDDEEDIYLTRRAFCSAQENIIFKSVQNGTDLFNYLKRQGQFADNEACDLPDVILMDINIPKENGFDLLASLKADDDFKHLPVSMLTTSSSKKDIHKAYQLGASSFICKSVSAEGMKKVAETFCSYWLNFAKLPSHLASDQ